MADFNLRYDLEAPGLLTGMVPDSRVTHTITGKAQSNIAAGKPVGWDDAAISTDVPVKGVVRLSTSLEQTDAGLVQYESGDDMPLVSWGPVLVDVDSAVTAGAAAYITLATGAFTATSGAGTTTAPCGYFETATAGAGQAVLFVQRGV